MKKRRIAGLALSAFLFVAVVMAVGFQWGCSDRIKGKARGTNSENQKPIVYFVNIPPDGQSTSQNPVVYWQGSDRDGQIKRFRYTVVKRSEMRINATSFYSPAEYAKNDLLVLPDSRWIYKDVIVDPVPDPSTHEIVEMSADLGSPVINFVDQYVFLQAIDDQGLHSDVAWKMISRNDHPPETRLRLPTLYNEATNPFINARVSGSIITGVPLLWRGEDDLDYPVGAPPYEFQWKLFGPYSGNKDEGEWEELIQKFSTYVFVTTDARVFRQGYGLVLYNYRDSVDTVADTVFSYLHDSILIDEIRLGDDLSQYGRLERLFLVDDSTFLEDSLYRLVDSSVSGDGTGWTSDTSQTMINLYRNMPESLTTQKRFLFWVRCRDDANVADLVPLDTPIGVIEPMFEKEVGVIDFSKLFVSVRLNAPSRGATKASDSGYQYWKRALETWACECQNKCDSDPLDTVNNSGFNFGEDDYYYLNARMDTIGLATLLQYKVVIAYHDDCKDASWLSGPRTNIYKAIDAGVNVWMIMRGALGGTANANPMWFAPLRDKNDPLMAWYFPLDSVRFTGWAKHAEANLFRICSLGVRIEDFMGAQAVNESSFPHPGWPDVKVDSFNLRTRLTTNVLYKCKLEYRDSLPYLPEVGVVIRQLSTDPLYLYQSAYSPEGHFLGSAYDYSGYPVAFRYGTSLFRTAFFSFTPLAMEDSTMQIVVDSVMEYLYAKFATSPVPLNRYPDAAIQVTAEDIAANERAREAMMEEWMKTEDIR